MSAARNLSLGLGCLGSAPPWRASPGEIGRSPRLSLVPVAIAYTSDVVAENMLRDVGYPEVAWLPIALLVVVGVPFCWRLLRF